MSMGVYINGMEMPEDCPMCPMAHYDITDTFRGCEIVAGKKHAINDPVYANSSTRPDWCPLAPVPPHGRLVDADALIDAGWQLSRDNLSTGRYEVALLSRVPTIIPAEEGE